MCLKIKRKISVLLVLGLGICQAWADPIVAIPDRIPGATTVDAEGVLSLASQFQNLVIIDSRIAGDRKHGYIDHSISLPNTNTSCKTLSKRIPTRSTPVLFYCNGVKCGRSVVATRIALACGYSKVYWFKGGFEEWLSKKYPYVKN
jgi:rhodanese-related sulfurtransferase